MSTVIPYNQLGLEIAILEGKEEEVDKCKMKIPRIEFEMQETVLKALEAGKRNILMLCEERTGELLGLAKDGGCV